MYLHGISEGFFDVPFNLMLPGIPYKEPLYFPPFHDHAAPANGCFENCE
jgi:hypothetical protein